MKITKLGKLAAYLILAINIAFISLLLLSAYSPYIDPVKQPVASCFGLAFPIFLFINGGFLTFWLIIRQYRYAFLALIGFLLCYPQIRTYLPVNLHTGQLPEESFKILSYNIMGFDQSKKENGKNPILEYLKNSDADILCLQEYTITKAPSRLSQKDIKEALQAYPYHSIQTIGTVKGYSNRIACFSKFPILSSRTIQYPSDYNGSAIHELKLGEDTLLLINNHMESNKLTKEDKKVYTEMLKAPETQKVKSGTRMLVRKLAEASAIRSVQADSVAEVIKTSRHPYIVCCGDFNDTPISYTHRILAQHLNSAFKHSGRGLGVSYNQNRFYFRIDGILTSKSLKSYNCTVDRSIKDSDHYPIWCYLKKQTTN